MKIRALTTLVWVILLVGCGDDAKPKDSVFVPDNNTNNTNNSVNPNNTPDPINNALECGEPGGVCELDCQVFASPDFCWNRARFLVYECMNEQVNGTMNPAGDTCTVGNVSIQFADAIDPEALADIEDWDFRIVQSGASCARVVSDDGFELTTRLGTVKIEVSAQEYSVECEDGSKWVTTNVFGLFDCTDNEGFTTLPGSTSFSAGNEFGFGLLPGSGNLFQCAFE